MPTRTIDVTGTLAPEMWSYKPLVPDVPPFEQRRWARVEERGWEADWFAMPTLAGTYLETAKHLFPEQPSIDEVPADRLFVDATVAKIPKGSREHITAADLEGAASGVQPGDALIVATGWDRHWWNDGRLFVLESPHFDREAMAWIVDHRVSILAGDFPCFDDPDAAGAQDVNALLFGSGALILAPLVGLAEITRPHVRLTALPLKLKGACGAPCRAFVTEER